MISQKSREQFFDRLYQEELKKKKKNDSEENNTATSSTVKNNNSRTRDEIVAHLYTDYFVRDTKLKTLQN